MQDYSPYLDWIDTQRPRMGELTAALAQINSGSHHLPGLEKCAAAIIHEFQPLGGQITQIALPPQQLMSLDGRHELHPLGRAMEIIKRPSAPLRVLLAIHFDTVFPADHTFQTTHHVNGRLHGPGVADAKGGLVVMLTALQALERSSYPANIGWEILLNPDEELGSPGSAHLFIDAAKRNHVGLLFEPAFDDGALVCSRKGSGNFTALVRGRSAHAGRNPQDGRNAIAALCEFITGLNRLNHAAPEITVNVGQIHGGTTPNVVPDRALCRFNVRVTSPQQQQRAQEYLHRIVAQINQQDGISIELSGSFTAPPKPIDSPMRQLMDYVTDCAQRLDIPIAWRESGGVSDGNRLAAAGLPNVDSLGVCGGGLHSSDEYMLLDSLTERAKLTALLLMRLASGELPWPPKL